MAMTTDGTDPGELSSLGDPRHDELPQDDLIPGQVQAGEPELGADGVPALDRPVRDRRWLRWVACLICGIIPAALVIPDFNDKLAGYQLVLGFAAGGLAIYLSGFLATPGWSKFEGVGKVITWVGGWLGIMGMVGLAVITWPHLMNGGM